MDPTATRSWLVNMVRQRRRLINSNLGKKNPLLCAKIVDNLTLYLNAYPYKGNSIYHFINRNYLDILIIIPSRQRQNFKKLEQCMQISREIKRIENGTEDKSPTQLQLSFW